MSKTLFIFITVMTITFSRILMHLDDNLACSITKITGQTLKEKYQNLQKDSNQEDLTDVGVETLQNQLFRQALQITCDENVFKQFVETSKGYKKDDKEKRASEKIKYTKTTNRITDSMVNSCQRLIETFQNQLFKEMTISRQEEKKFDPTKSLAKLAGTCGTKAKTRRKKQDL